MSSVCGYLEDTDSEGPLITEGLVPTPTFSGQVEFNRPSAISFAPATAQLASSTAQGTLMADFSAEPSILRDWRDMFPKKDFVKLVITVCAGVLQSFLPFAHIHIVAGLQRVDCLYGGHRRGQGLHNSYRISKIRDKRIHHICKRTHSSPPAGGGQRLTWSCYLRSWAPAHAQVLNGSSATPMRTASETHPWHSYGAPLQACGNQPSVSGEYPTISRENPLPRRVFPRSFLSYVGFEGLEFVKCISLSHISSHILHLRVVRIVGERETPSIQPRVRTPRSGLREINVYSFYEHIHQFYIATSEL